MKGGKHKHSVHNNSELYLGHPECLTTLEKSQKVSKLCPYKSEPEGRLWVIWKPAVSLVASAAGVCSSPD